MQNLLSALQPSCGPGLRKTLHVILILGIIIFYYCYYLVQVHLFSDDLDTWFKFKDTNDQNYEKFFCINHFGLPVSPTKRQKITYGFCNYVRDLWDRTCFFGTRNSYYLASKEFFCSYFTGLFLAFMYTNIIARLAFIQILHPNYHKHKRWQECFLVVYRVYEVRRQEISFSPFTPKIGQNFQISSCKMLRIDSPL